MKKNIAIIISCLKAGGAERTAANLSVVLNEEYNVHLIVCDASEIVYPFAGTLHDLHLPPMNGKINKTFQLVKRVRKIKKIKRENNIFCSISLMEGPNLLNTLSRCSDKIITSIRIQMSKVKPNEKVFSKRINDFVLKYNCKHSNFVVALSKGVEEDLISHYGIDRSKVITIYNPCDYELLKKKADANPMIVESNNALVTMGRLTEQKGHWHLIRAIAEVKKRIPDVKLYIFGEGILQSKLEKLITDLKLDKNVKLMGYYTSPHATFKYCDAFVFPSNYEGLGNVLLEAQAFGLPCISSDCLSGPREILAPGTIVKEKLDEIEFAKYGILVSVCGPNQFNAVEPLTKEEIQLKDAIIEILTNPELKSRYANQSKVRAKDFLPEIIENEWKRLI